MRKLATLVVAAMAAVACSGVPSNDGVIGPDGPVGPDGPGSAEAVAGSGTVTSVTHDVVDFDRIELAGEGSVVVIIADTHSLTVRTDNNLHTYLDVAVVGTTLRLATVTGSNIDLEPTDSITWTVTAPAVTALALTGAGAIDADGITAERLEILLRGAGDIAVTGDTDTLIVALTGAGSIDAAGLVAVDAAATHGGVGDMMLHVTGTLAIEDTGSVGSITVTGSPTLRGDIGLVTQD